MSTIELLESRVVRLKIEPNTEWSAGHAQRSSPHGGIQIGYSDDLEHWTVSLTINKGKDTVGGLDPLHLEMEISGDFRLHQPESLRTSMHMVGVNGCSILYSAAREYIQLLTSRFEEGAVFLPTINFNGVLPVVSEEEEQEFLARRAARAAEAALALPPKKRARTRSRG